jgi:hypothetical protein
MEHKVGEEDVEECLNLDHREAHTYARLNTNPARTPNIVQ